MRGRVWDLPVRVTHWLLAACVLAAWLTRDARLIDLHAAAGYCALFLVAFRIAWGFLGPIHARFDDFAYSPRAVLDYLRGALRGTPPHFTSHNPAGSWAVYALLAGTLLAVVTGVLAIGAQFSMGPVPLALPYARIDVLRETHEWTAWILLAVIVLHVAGVFWGSWLHRENLVASMFSGRKRRHETIHSETPAHFGIGVAVAASAAVVTACYLGAAGWHEGYARLQAAAPAPAVNAWRKECGDCHLAYEPSLLPRRSWERMLRGQARHFGEDLSLSAANVRELLAVESQMPPPSWSAWKLGASVAAGEAPLRVTASPFWRHAHRNIPGSAFKSPVSEGRHDCEACHRDAAAGTFHPRMIEKPANGFTP